MEYRFNLTRQRRKELATVISEIINAPVKYHGTPTFAYEVGEYHIDKEGTMTGEYCLSLMAELEARGFEAEPSHTFHFITPRGTLLIRERFDTADEAEAAGYGIYFSHEAHDIYTKPSGKDEHSNHFALVGGPLSSKMPQPDGQGAPAAFDDVAIDIPLEGFTPTAIENLRKMVLAKEPLIKKALSAETLPIEISDTHISFPWFKASDSESAEAYAQFIAALCNTAKEKKRVNAKAQDSFENERFAMRVWLIGLGMVGAEYKLARKLLTAPLSGNSAWRYGKPEVAEEIPTVTMEDAIAAE